ncbi:MAG: hypothetical protein AAFX99_33700, partial [Myxococcota bacterium]
MTHMMAHVLGLALSLTALALGPLLYSVGRRTEALLSVLRGLVLVAIGALVLVMLLPELIATAGAGVVVALLAGLALPLVLERFGQHAPRHTRSLVLGTAMLSLLLHALLDGVALGMHGEEHHLDLTLAVAVVLHRLPVGLVIWMFVQPYYGKGYAWGVLGAVMVATTAGFGLGMGGQIPEGEVLAYAQAFVGGSLLHVLAHTPHHPEAHAATRHAPRWETLGAVLGGLLVWLLPHHHDHGHQHGEHAHAAWDAYGHRFLDMALETAPALLLGYLLAGLLRVMLPQ